MEPHHDGSDAYVLDRPNELGGSATVRLRIPRGTQVDDVALLPRARDRARR